MLTEEYVRPPGATAVKHAAVGKPVVLTAPPDPRYPGKGPATLTDGKTAPEDHTSRHWIGYQGADLEATVDLGAPTDLQRVGASFLQSTPVGIFLPKKVEILVSNDGKSFRLLKTLSPPLEPRKEGPVMSRMVAGGLEERARYVRIRALHLGKIPDWHAAKGLSAWLFIDEVLVNPQEEVRSK